MTGLHLISASPLQSQGHPRGLLQMSFWGGCGGVTQRPTLVNLRQEGKQSEVGSASQLQPGWGLLSTLKSCSGRVGGPHKCFPQLPGPLRQSIASLLPYSTGSRFHCSLRGKQTPPLRDGGGQRGTQSSQAYLPGDASTTLKTDCELGFQIMLTLTGRNATWLWLFTFRRVFHASEDKILARMLQGF